MANQALKKKITYWGEKEENTRDRSVPNGSVRYTRGVQNVAKQGFPHNEVILYICILYLM